MKDVGENRDEEIREHEDLNGRLGRFPIDYFTVSFEFSLCIMDRIDVLKTIVHYD